MQPPIFLLLRRQEEEAPYECLAERADQSECFCRMPEQSMCEDELPLPCPLNSSLLSAKRTAESGACQKTLRTYMQIA